MGGGVECWVLSCAHFIAIVQSLRVLTEYLVAQDGLQKWRKELLTNQSHLPKEMIPELSDLSGLFCFLFFRLQV